MCAATEVKISRFQIRIHRCLKAAGPKLAGLTGAMLLTAALLGLPVSLSAQESYNLSGSQTDQGWVAADLRVELRAPTMVMLSAPAGGRLAQILVKDGEDFQKDDLLVQLDDRLPSLRLAMATASRDQAATQLRLVEKLHKLGSRGALDVEMAQAQFQGAEAERLLAEEMVKLCQIRAPWKGRVTQLEVKENQHVQEGAQLLELAEDGPMEVEFMMPSSWLPYFKAGSLFEVKVDETGERYPAETLRLGGKIDPLTQSVRVYGRLTGSSEGLAPGMTGMVGLPPPEPRP